MTTDFDDLVDESVPTKKTTKRGAEAPGQRSSALRSAPVRKRRIGSKSEDHFYIPEDLKQILLERGLSAEFKRVTYFGKEEEPDYHIALSENGWEPLSLKDFPAFKRMLSKNWTKDTFEKRGQILMVRPQSLTDEARAEEKKFAQDRVKGHMASLTNAGPNEGPRDNKGAPLVQVNRTYERGVPID